MIEPFVVAVEWLYMSIFNAPVARRRSPAQLALAAEQQQHVWQALAREVRPGVCFFTPALWVTS